MHVLVIGCLTVLLGLATMGCHAAGSGQIIKVGPSQALKTPSQAAAVARDGDIVEIEPGTYSGDVAIWRQDELTIRGAGATPRIDARGKAADGKAIWVVQGAGVTIENVELLNCTVPDRNGAALRAEGRDLTLRRVNLHHNQMGILTSAEFGGQLLIERAEIHHNTVDYEATGSLGHNIYVSHADRFVLQGSWVHGAVTGHNVKSRALENLILYNRIEDGADGAASYQIDLAEAAPSFVIGNVIEKGERADNHTFVSFAAEADEREDVPVLLANNTLINHGRNGLFLRNASRSRARLVNNILAGVGRAGSGAIDEAANVDLALRDIEPTGAVRRSSRAATRIRDKGMPLPAVDGIELVPTRHYVHPLQLEPRPVLGMGLDVGAYEIVD